MREIELEKLDIEQRNNKEDLDLKRMEIDKSYKSRIYALKPINISNHVDSDLVQKQENPPNDDDVVRGKINKDDFSMNDDIVDVDDDFNIKDNKEGDNLTSEDDHSSGNSVKYFF
jgi:hypothetical protein